LGGRKLKVGLVTIGQSPRTDVTPTLKEMLGPEVELIEKGALDRMTRKEIDTFAPAPRDYVLVTRLRNGTFVRVARARILSRVQKCVKELEEMNVDLTVLLCTGDFPEVKAKELLIKPDKLISNVAWGILEHGKLGVVVPEKEQIPLLRATWEKKGVSLVMIAANPYGETEASEEAAAILAEENVDLIILDCIGFTPKMKEIFRRLTGKPVVLPQTLLGRVLKELAST
jgi:protein AroM